MKPLVALAALGLLALCACGDGGTTANVSKDTAAPPPAAAAVPVPSTWAATEIAGKPLVSGSTVTLEFAADGKVSGAASCNRFAGPVTLEGSSIKFGALAVTRMACVGEGLSAQETAYLAALTGADHLAVTGDTLEMTGRGGAPVRFRKAAP